MDIKILHGWWNVNYYNSCMYNNHLTEALLLAPHLGNVLGGTPVQLSGPCFEETDNITCLFGDAAIIGSRLDRNRVLCVSPELNVISRITLELIVVRADEEVFNGQVTFHSSKLQL